MHLNVQEDVQVSLTPHKAIGTLARLAEPAVPHTPNAQVAELVDALVSGISGAIRGGSSPLLGTIPKDDSFKSAIRRNSDWSDGDAALTVLYQLWPRS
jgi:hypothetical protein